MDTFDGMEVFARVVEARSFTGAARQLRVSKSWISESVRALEARLGVRLLDRTTRRLSPTEAGWAFFARCKKAIEEAEAGRTEVQAMQEEPMGRLRVASPETFSRFYIVSALPKFLAENPALSVELVEGTRYEDLIEARLDLAIRITPANAPGDIVRRIGTSEVCAIASPAYLEKAGRPVEPDDIRQHRCVGFSPLFWAYEWRFQRDGSTVTVPIAPRMLTNSTESLRDAAANGIGLVAMPKWAAADLLNDGRVVQVLEDWQMPVSGIFAVYPSNRLMTPKVKRFVDHVAAAIRDAGL